MLHHVWHWFMDIIGVNNTYDPLGTRMYNFWSGFGANVSLLALTGTVVGVYRSHLKRINNAINPLNLVRKIEQIEKDKKSSE